MFGCVLVQPPPPPPRVCVCVCVLSKGFDNTQKHLTLVQEPRVLHLHTSVLARLIYEPAAFVRLRRIKDALLL